MSFAYTAQVGGCRERGRVQAMGRNTQGPGAAFSASCDFDQVSDPQPLT